MCSCECFRLAEMILVRDAGAGCVGGARPSSGSRFLCENTSTFSMSHYSNPVGRKMKRQHFTMAVCPRCRAIISVGVCAFEHLNKHLCLRLDFWMSSSLWFFLVHRRECYIFADTQTHSRKRLVIYRFEDIRFDLDAMERANRALEVDD